MVIRGEKMKSIRFFKILSLVMFIVFVLDLPAYAYVSNLYGSINGAIAVQSIPTKLSVAKTHTGVINPRGETWRKVDSPHIINGVFRVEGYNSPVLTIEAGATVMFNANARIEVGRDGPGAIIAKGKTGAEIVFSANTKTPRAGAWGGIWFLENTLQGRNFLENCRILNAGAKDKGAVYVYGSPDGIVDVQLKNVQIANSLYAGLNMEGNGRLSVESSNLKITGTQKSGALGGWPIVTSFAGSDFLPDGVYTPNAVNAVDIVPDGYIERDTVWRNVGIPYAITKDVTVAGEGAPTLSIEPGVITLWAKDTRLDVGGANPGYLAADAQAQPSWIRVERPDGNGDWINMNAAGSNRFWVAKPEGGGDWFPDPKAGDRFLWVIMPDGTREVIAAPDINLPWSLDLEPDPWGDQAKTWPINYFTRLDRNIDSEAWVTLVGENDEEILIPKPKNENDWLYIVGTDGGGNWVGLPDGSFRAACIPGVTGMKWISLEKSALQGTGGGTISMTKTEHGGPWSENIIIDPEGNEWKPIAAPKQLAAWNTDNKFTILSKGLSTANGNSVMTGPTCSLCGSNPSIVFGSLEVRWDSQRSQYSMGERHENAIASIDRDLASIIDAWSAPLAIEAWNGWCGIDFKGPAVNKSILRGVVVAYTDEDDHDDNTAAIFVEGYAEGQPVKTPGLLVADSLITQNTGTAVELGRNVVFNEKSINNYLIGNFVPLRVSSEAIGSIPAENHFSASIPENMVPLFNLTSERQRIPTSEKTVTPEDLTNINEWVSVFAEDGVGRVTRSALWKNLGIPYLFEANIAIGGVEAPIVTIEAGTRLMFDKDCGIEVGIINEGNSGSGAGLKGSLVIDGTIEKPVVFTSMINAQPGSWNGVTFTQYAGQGNRIGSVMIEFAKEPLLFKGSFAPFVPIKNPDGNLIIK